MLHMMRWSMPDSIDTVREFSMPMSCTIESHINPMKMIIKYVVTIA